jgi:hypothetical protein
VYRFALTNFFSGNIDGVFSWESQRNAWKA